MPFKPNYRFERNERDRLKQARARPRDQRKCTIGEAARSSRQQHVITCSKVRSPVSRLFLGSFCWRAPPEDRWRFYEVLRGQHGGGVSPRSPAQGRSSLPFPFHLHS